MAAHTEILTSEQGGKKLLYDGNVFYRKGAHKGTTYWKCKRCNLGVEARGGARLSPGTFSDPPHALLPTHASVQKKSLILFGP